MPTTKRLTTPTTQPSSLLTESEIGGTNGYQTTFINNDCDGLFLSCFAYQRILFDVKFCSNGTTKLFQNSFVDEASNGDWYVRLFADDTLQFSLMPLNSFNPLLFHVFQSGAAKCGKINSVQRLNANPRCDPTILVTNLCV